MARRSVALVAALLLAAACASTAAPTAKPAASPADGAAPPAVGSGATAPVPRPRPPRRSGRSGAPARAPRRSSGPATSPTARASSRRRTLRLELVAIPSAFTLTQALVSRRHAGGQLHGAVDGRRRGRGAPLKMVASAQMLPNNQLVVAPEIRDVERSARQDARRRQLAGRLLRCRLQMMLAANGLRTASTRPARCRATRACRCSGRPVRRCHISDQEPVVAMASGFPRSARSPVRQGPPVQRPPGR